MVQDCLLLSLTESNFCPNHSAIAEISKLPHTCSFSSVFSQLLESPIHQVAQTGKLGLMPFALFALIPYIISQSVLPRILIHMCLIHPLLSIPSSQDQSLFFLGPKYYSCLLQIDPFHSHQNGPLKMQVRPGYCHV